MGDQPGGQEPSVGAAHHPQPVAVETREPVQRGVERRGDVGYVDHPPTGRPNRTHEVDTAPAGTARVAGDDPEPGSGVHLELVEKGEAVLGCRSSVDIEQSRNPFRAGGKIDPHVDLLSVRDDPEHLGFRQIDPLPEPLVQ